MGILNFLFGKPDAQFEKVSYVQYATDWKKCFNESQSDDVLETIYNSIELPERSTEDSSGYNFTIPFSFKLKLGESIVIPTGIRCKMGKKDFLMIVPRSGQGFKYRLSLVNTAGIIDSDYYSANNEGHIMIKITYDGIPEKNYNLSTKRAHKVLKNNEVSIFLEGSSLDSIIPAEIKFEAGKGFAQGILLRYRIAKEKKITQKRVGGFGSTDKQ